MSQPTIHEQLVELIRHHEAKKAKHVRLAAELVGSIGKIHHNAKATFHHNAAVSLATTLALLRSTGHVR